MKEPPEPQQAWTLWEGNITLHAGELIEYRRTPRETRIARVKTVEVVRASGYPDVQVIRVKLYGKLSRLDGPRETTIQPAQILRVLDTPPLPPAKYLTSLWSPRDEHNPFRVESELSNEEWREIARWYPFSIRMLNTQSSKATWQEQARTRSWNEAKEAMTALAQLHRKQCSCWVVLKHERRGKEGREKPVMWYPGPASVRATLREVGLLHDARDEKP